MARKPIEIDCEEVWKHISDYIDDEVNPELHAMMAAHFKDCAHCSAILDGTSNIVQLVGDGRAFEVPERVGKTLYDKLNDHLARKQKWNS